MGFVVGAGVVVDKGGAWGLSLPTPPLGCVPRRPAVHTPVIRDWAGAGCVVHNINKDKTRQEPRSAKGAGGFRLRIMSFGGARLCDVLRI